MEVIYIKASKEQIKWLRSIYVSSLRNKPHLSRVIPRTTLRAIVNKGWATEKDGAIHITELGKQQIF